MTAPSSMLSDEQKYGFVPEAPEEAKYGFVPDGSPLPAEEMENILAEDKNLVLGMPKGADLDEINLRALTSIYQKPKEDFFLGVPDKLMDFGQGAMSDVVVKAKDLLGGNLRMAADAMEQPASWKEVGSFFTEWNPIKRQDVTVHMLARGGQKIVDFINGIDDWATDVYAGGKRPEGSQDFQVRPAAAMRRTADRLQDFSKAVIERFQLKPDTDNPYNDEMISPDQPVNPLAEELAFGLGQGAMSALTSIGLAYATKRPDLVAGLFGLQMTGGKYQEYVDRGMDPAKARQYAILAGAGEGGLEYLGLEVFVNMLRGSKVIARIALRTATEAVQEMSQQGSEILVDTAAGVDRTPEQAVKEVVMAGFIGAMIGAPAAGISTAFEESSYFGDLRKRYNLNDEETKSIIEKRTAARVNEVKQHMAKKLNEELADAEIKLAQDGPPPVRVEVSPEIQRENMIVQLEDLRDIQAELEVYADQMGSPEQARQYREGVQSEIARLESVLGVQPQEARFSRKGQQKQSGIIAYHGTTANFKKFSPKHAEMGFHFGTEAQARDRISGVKGGKVKKYVLDIKNPYDVVSDLGDWSDMDMLREYFGPANEGPFTAEQVQSFQTPNDFVDALEKLGYDGIKYENAFEDETGETSDKPAYIAFRPEQIQEYQEPNKSVRFSRRDQDKLGFYSAAIRAIEDKMPASATPEQVLGILRNTQGVKKEELDEIGIEAFLNGKDKVTKKEVQDFMDEGGVQIEEVVLGQEKEQQKQQTLQEIQQKFSDQGYDLLPAEPGEVTLLKNGEEIEYDDLPSDLQLLADLYEQTEGNKVGGAKFGSYQTPGGKNYREILLTLPFETNDPKETVGEVQSRTFQSSHFNEPNILVHIRVNDRLVDGKAVLFIEEIQSDWHQKGRKEGYQSEQAEWKIVKQETFKYEADRENPYFIYRNGEAVGSEATQQAAEKELASLKKQDSSEGVPDAPFKKTWHELALKRMLRYAAENGYDAIAWTTGQQQAERYDLSKQIESVKFKKNPGKNTYDILVNDKNGDDVLAHSEADAKYIEDNLGKEIAKKITESDSTEGELRGLDLKVGGEGMKGFYDQIIPAFLNKYTKKWGGRVQQIDLAGSVISQDLKDFITDFNSPSTAKAVRIVFNQMDESFTVKTYDKYGNPKQDHQLTSDDYQRIVKFDNRFDIAEAFSEDSSEVNLGGDNIEATVSEKVHALKLTGELRAGVMEGQPLFARGSEGSSTAAQVQAKIEQLSKGMGNLPEIIVFQTAEEAIVSTGQSIPDDAEAFFVPRRGNRDQIIMIAERLAPDRVAFVFYHELVGHYGLRSLYGVKFDSAMKDIFDRSPKIRARAQAIMNKYSEYDQATATEEALSDEAAELAKEKKYPAWWETILSRLRALARNLGLDLELSDTDLNVILADARKMVEKKPADTDLTAKQILDSYNAAIQDADQAKAELEALQPAVDFFRENLSIPTKGLEEDFKWKQIPRAFKAGKGDIGFTLDHLIKKIGQAEGERDVRIPEFNNESDLADYMIQLWQSYTYARARSRKPVPPRLRQEPTVSSAAWLKRRNAVLRARQAGKQAGSDQVSYLMLKQDMRRLMSEEVLKDRIEGLKARIRDVKARTLQEREAAREEYYAKQADQKRQILWKLQRKEAVAKSIEEYIADNLPPEKRGALLKVARSAGTSQKAIAKAFDRVQRTVDAYIRQQTIDHIKKLAQKAQAASVAVDYRKAVERIVEDLDFQKPTSQTKARLAKLKKYIDEKLAAGEDPGVGRDEYEALRRLEKVSVAELTQLDLLNIMDRIALLIRIGQTKRELLKNRWDTDKAAALELLKTGARNLGRLGAKNPMIRTKLGGKEIADNTWQDFRAGLRKADWALLPMDAFIDMLDGYKDYRGANYRIFKNRIDLSFQHYLDLKDKMVRPLVELGEKLKLDEEAYYHIGVFAADEQEDGRKKLLAYAESEEEVDFLNGIIDEIKANMTAAELKWYGEARQVLDALRPQIAEVMRRVYNKDFTEVKNYFPFMMNFDAMSETEIERRFGDSVEMFGKKPKGDVKKGFTEERVGGAFKVRLNALDVVTQHLDNASYLVEMGESIKFLQQIASSKDYQKIVGQDAQDFMVNWLSLLAKKGALKRDGGLDTARRMAGIYALGFRLSTGLIQATAIMDGASYIGGYVVNGMSKMIEDPWRKFILDNMPELRDRVGDDPAVAQLEFVAAPQNLSDVVKVLQSKTTKIGYAHIRWMDSIVAQSVAGGAYLKYLDDNKIELDLKNPNQEALNYAQLVLRRTQASAFVKDLPAAISRGALTGDSVSWGKLVFQFQTFMLNRWSVYRNDVIAAGIKGKRPEAINKLMILLMAAFMEVMLRRGVNLAQEGLIDMMRELMGKSPVDDDDDDDSILEEWFSALFRNIPIVGPAVDSLKYGSFPVPAVEILSRPLETASALMRSKRQEAKNRNMTRLAVQSAGMVFGGGGQADQIVKQLLSD